MNLHTAHCLLPLRVRTHHPGQTLLYIDHGGLADGTSWRRRVRARIGGLAYGLLSRPRF